MRGRRVSLPTLVAIAATRGMIGLGAGLLLAGRLRRDRRKPVGWALLAIGAASTIPLAARLIRDQPTDEGRFGDLRVGDAASMMAD